MADGDNLVLGQENTAASQTELDRGATAIGATAFGLGRDPNHPAPEAFAFGVANDDGDAILGFSATNLGLGALSYGDTALMAQCGTYDENGNFPPSGYGITAIGGNIGLFAYNPSTALTFEDAPDFDTLGNRVYLATRGLAADFYGDVYVHGNFTLSGGHKSAVVQHPDGSDRQLYCLESPENWFEDFGRGEVVNGVGEVTLDRDFASLVRTDDYTVFLTEYGDSAGLYVSEQRPEGFVVRERRGGTSSLPFRYRVVARRKDLDRSRLEPVSPPAPPPQPPRGFGSPDRQRKGR